MMPSSETRTAGAQAGAGARTLPAADVPSLLTPPERQLQAVLRILAALFLAAVLAYWLGAVVEPFRAFFRQLPFVSNSVVKVGVMMMLCVYAAGDVRGRRGLVLLVVAAHALSILAMSVLLIGGETARLVPLFGRGVPVGQVLWGAMALDGLITALLLVLYLRAGGDALRLPSPAARGGAETAPERRMRVLLYGFGALFALSAAGYVAGALLPAYRAFFVELPFVSNSAVKTGTLAMVSLYAAARLRRDLSLAGIVVAAHLLSALAQLGYLVFLRTGFEVTVGGSATTMTALLGWSVVLDLAIAAVLFACYQAAWKARYGIRFFRPAEYRTLIALADVIVRGEEEPVPHAEIAANVERYIHGIRARRRWVYRLALFGMFLHPLLYFRAPFPELDEETRLRHLKRHFHRDVLLRLVPDWWRRVVQVMIRVCTQLTYVGYYNDPRSYEAVGYRPFTERPRFAQLKAEGKVERRPHPLKVELPRDVDGDAVEADVCIVGSGAGGAILAYELAAKGREVLVLERGRYVPPAEFSEDEVEMIGKLYADGIFQQTQDFRFTILQGSCVGGSTTVNNAVCFEPPDDVLARWNDPETLDAGLDLDDLRKSVRDVGRFVSVQSQQDAVLNPSYPKFTGGVLAVNPSVEVDAVRANIQGCVGCGYCNIGCAYGKKLSMLDTALPWAQRDFPGRVRILAECDVERIRTLSGSPRRALDLKARLSDGRRITVRADRFVVAAGAVASSYLLLRSGVGRDLPVGRRLGFNMGTYLTADFQEPLDAYDGLQISHYGLPHPWEGYVYETWWNPPVAQAINMPGWFEDHYRNMRRYRHLMAVGVLVGTKMNARVRQALTGGADIQYRPDPGDLHTLARGLEQLGRVLFEAGATRVMPNSWGYDVFTRPEELRRLYDIVADPSYVTLGTGHPQGGNPISRDPKRGVVDPGFRVHGYDNLYVCDASVIPDALTVNPQQTVMGLAHYAAARIH